MVVAVFPEQRLLPRGGCCDEAQVVAGNDAGGEIDQPVEIQGAGGRKLLRAPRAGPLPQLACADE